MNITLIGMPGSGKSYIGKKLAKSLNYELIELDTLIENSFNLPLQQVLEKLGMEKFIEEEGDAAILYTDKKDNLVISPGGSIVYSDKAMHHFKKISKIIYLKADLETLQKRIGEKSRGIVGLKEKTLEQLYIERSALYEKWADTILDTKGGVNKIIKNIKSLSIYKRRR